MLVRRVFGSFLLLGLVTSIGSARADLRQQYSEQGCVRWFENYIEYIPRAFYCVDRRGNVFVGYKKIIEHKYGEIGKAVQGLSAYTNAIVQFEYEGNNLVMYSCNPMGTNQCQDEIKRNVFQPLDEIQ